MGAFLLVNIQLELVFISLSLYICVSCSRCLPVCACLALSVFVSVYVCLALAWSVCASVALSHSVLLCLSRSLTLCLAHSVCGSWPVSLCVVLLSIAFPFRRNLCVTVALSVFLSVCVLIDLTVHLCGCLSLSRFCSVCLKRNRERGSRTQSKTERDVDSMQTPHIKDPNHPNRGIEQRIYPFMYWGDTTVLPIWVLPQ